MSTVCGRPQGGFGSCGQGGVKNLTFCGRHKWMAPYLASPKVCSGSGRYIKCQIAIIIIKKKLKCASHTEVWIQGIIISSYKVSKSIYSLILHVQMHSGTYSKWSNDYYKFIIHRGNNSYLECGQLHDQDKTSDGAGLCCWPKCRLNFLGH